MPLGFGIIGCGMISRFHARAIGDVRGTKLIGGYDRVPELAQKLGESTGCKVYRELDDLLADPAIQVVTIATPSGAHMEIDERFTARAAATDLTTARVCGNVAISLDLANGEKVRVNVETDFTDTSAQAHGSVVVDGEATFNQHWAFSEEE